MQLIRYPWHSYRYGGRVETSYRMAERYFPSDGSSTGHVSGAVTE